jgi:GAF domain-containing protein
MNQPSSLDTLDQARATIARQAEEIEALQQQLQREQFAEELRQLLSGLEATSIILAPFTHSRLLEMVVQTAMQVISAQAGSLFLIDEEAKDLVFEVAIGPKSQAAKQFRVPLGHGIAGMVAVSGQPMAIMHADEDQRLAIDIASSVDYVPKSVLCVPLFYDDHVIGALELLNKIGEPSFRPTDIEMLALFAKIAAIAIAQSRAYQDQRSMLNALLRSFGEQDSALRQRLYQGTVAFSNWAEKDCVADGRARKLALLVYELTSYGENEYEMCVNILQSFVSNLRNRQGGYDFSLSGSVQGRGF